MGNVLHVIFRYFINTQAGVARGERLLLHKGGANNVCLPLSHIVVYRDTDIVYWMIQQCTSVSFGPSTDSP